MLGKMNKHYLRKYLLNTSQMYGECQNTKNIVKSYSGEKLVGPAKNKYICYFKIFRDID